jgi:hypothetical protein
MAAPLLGTVSAAMGTGADLGTGYVASLWVAAAVCAVGAVLAAALFRPGPLHRRAADSATISGAAAAS